jgi:hypothetical protein
MLKYVDAFFAAVGGGDQVAVGLQRIRRVSMSLRHSGMEFSEFNCLSFGVC